MPPSGRWPGSGWTAGPCAPGTGTGSTPPPGPRPGGPEVPRLGEPGVLLDGSAVLVLGDAADGPLGVGADESELSVLDLADGTETARLRLGRTEPSGLRILGVGPGRLLLCRPD